MTLWWLEFDTSRVPSRCSMKWATAPVWCTNRNSIALTECSKRHTFFPTIITQIVFVTMLKKNIIECILFCVFHYDLSDCHRGYHANSGHVYIYCYLLLLSEEKPSSYVALAFAIQKKNLENYVNHFFWDFGKMAISQTSLIIIMFIMM